MKFKRQIKVEDQVNLTPLIDVVFLLLIFFMVSTTFTRETHLEVNLPTAEGEQSAQQKSSIEVVVDAQGQYAVNGEVLVNTEINTLERAIEKISKGEREIPFIITGDADSSYQAIVSVMDLAGRMGFANLSMTTRAPGKDE